MTVDALIIIVIHLFSFFLSLCVSVMLVWTYFNFRTRVILHSLLMSLVLAIYFSFRVLQLYYGSYLYNFETAFLMHYLREISLMGLFFLVPRYLEAIAPPEGEIRKYLHKGFLLLFGAAGIFIILAAVSTPEDFVSLVSAGPSSLPHINMWGSGETGFLYAVRNVFLSLISVYSLVYLITYRWVQRRLFLSSQTQRSEVLRLGNWFTLGMLIFIIFSALSIVQEADFFRNAFLANAPFFSIGVALFVSTLFFQVTQQLFSESENIREMRDRYHIKSIELDYLATHDSTSGLNNQHAFLNKLEQFFSVPVAEVSNSSLISIIWKNYYELLQTRGLNFIYETLIAFTQEIVDVCPEGSTLFRMNSDDFVLWLENDGTSTSLDAQIRKIHNLFRDEISVGNLDVYLQIKLSVLKIPDDAKNFETTMRNLSILQKHSWSSRNTKPIFFKFEDSERSIAKVRKVEKIGQILQNRKLHYAYQPICNHKSEIHSAEMLLRINNPQDWKNPGEFISLAEESGLIFELNTLLMEMVAVELNNFNEAGLSPLLHINLSPQQILDPAFLDHHLPLLRATGFPADKLCFEITENDLILNIDDLLDVISQIRSQGSVLALDDFGSGYSSFKYLSELPVDILKVDKHFVDGVEGGGNIVSILESLSEICKAARLTSILEGVESDAQFELVSPMGFNLYQGYYFYRPVSFEELLRQLRK